MKNIKAFILGITTVIVIIPIVESVVDALCTGIEYFKGKFTISVLKLNKEIIDLQSAQEEVSTQCVGFEMSAKEEDEYYDDEEDCTNKSKFGFVKTH